MSLARAEPSGSGFVTVQGLIIRFESSHTRLDTSLALTDDLATVSYRFNYRRDDVLLWRADCHPGHETQFGGPHHLHLGPTEHLRVASPDYSLQDIADLVIRTNLSLER